MTDALFDASTVALSLRAETQNLREQKTAGPKLEARRQQIIALKQAGASHVEIKRWLEREGLQVSVNAISFWLKRQDELVKTSANSVKEGTYSEAQLQRICSVLSPRNALPARICFHTGIRPREVPTLKPTDTGYAVVQLDGIERSIELPEFLRPELESYALGKPRSFIEGATQITQYYELAGSTWVKAFNDASKRELTFTFGVDGLRSAFIEKQLNNANEVKPYSELIAEIAAQMGGLPSKLARSKKFEPTAEPDRTSLLVKRLSAVSDTDAPVTASSLVGAAIEIQAKVNRPELSARDKARIKASTARASDEAIEKWAMSQPACDQTINLLLRAAQLVQDFDPRCYSLEYEANDRLISVATIDASKSALAQIIDSASRSGMSANGILQSLLSETVNSCARMGLPKNLVIKALIQAAIAHQKTQ